MLMSKVKNKVLENLEVTGYAAGGKSIAKLEGKVVFIEGAVPGDVVDVRLSKNKKDWADGKAIRFERFSHDRVVPFCKHFGVCGGCKWQMLPYEKQLQYKQQEVADQMKRIGKIDLPEMLPIAGSSETIYYRNKLEFTFSSKKYFTQAEMDAIPMPEDGPRGLPSIPALGFHVPGSFDKVIDIDECFLQSSPTNEIRNFIREYSLAHGVSFYDIRNHTGLLRNLMVRLCSTRDLMVNLVFGDDNEKIRIVLLDAIKLQFPQITSLFYTINRKMNDSLQDQTPILYHGNPFAIEQLGNLKFKVSPKSFFQTNTKQAERLYQITKDFADLKGHEIVYDLYCGTGSIGIFLSDRAKKIVGVEVVEEAVEDAHENATLNGINNAAFFAGDVANVCNDVFFEQHGRPDVIITDPPRAGMHEKLVNQILMMEAPVVVYVSCNPATQARDLQLLSEKYRVTAIQPVDMFPHTHHIENVVQLRLKDL
jgi:23S rRNA (uracil1939-C5)-methyltransferase